MDINKLSTETKNLLERAGVQPEQLQQIAGIDGIITGRAETKDLYSLIEDYDSNGTTRSLQTSNRTSDGTEIFTGSGELYEALKGEVVARQRDAHIRGVNGARRLSKDNIDIPPHYRASGTDRANAIHQLTDQGLSDIHITPNTMFYGQGNSKWSQRAYPRVPAIPGETRIMQKAGCGPTALAIVDATLSRRSTTPIDTADFAIERGYSGSYNPSTGKKGSTKVAKLVTDWARDRFEQAETGKGKSGVDNIRNGLADGGVALVSVNRSHFTSSRSTGHIMVINGCAKDDQGKEWFFVVNPGQQNPAGTLKRRGLVEKDGDISRTQDGHVVINDNLHHGTGRVRVSREYLETKLKYGYTFQRDNEA